MLMRKMILGIVVAVLVSISGIASGTTYYVSPDGNDLNNGLSWATAFATIQKGIDTATNGDTVDVNEGTYYESIDFDGKAITVESTDPNDWDVVDQTVIDANGDDEAVEFHTSEGIDSVLKGFKITGADRRGIRCRMASPTIADCFITGNGSSSYEGGGMDNDESSPTVTNCVFNDNTAEIGGGMYNDEASPTVIGCVFHDNTAEDGAGMYNDYDSVVVVINCLFYDNEADYDGGGIHNDESSADIINCTFRYNESDSDDGGGVYNDDSDCNIINCIFWRNYADDEGDEIYNRYSTCTISYCDIDDCGGSGAGWDPDLGTDGGGNIDVSPDFANTSDPDGADNQWLTHDDGLRLEYDSSCIDAADGNVAAATDILGLGRFDVNEVNNTGTGDPNYVDIGAYERHEIWFVDPNATGKGDGTSWEDAFTGIQDALDADYATGWYNEIWVAAGTYKPSKETDPCDASSATFQLADGVSLYGGFAGTETDRNQRDWITNETILSGDIDGDESCDTDNCYHVVTGADSSVLDGFTVTMGYASGSDANSDGAGIYCSDVLMTIGNCTFSTNRATRDGGGLYIQESTITLTGCTFSWNAILAPRYVIGHGAAICDYNSSGAIVNCIFTNNMCRSSESGSGGGAIYDHNCVLTLENCVFSDNQVRGSDGGALYNHESSPVVINCTLNGNTTGYYGGGMYSSGSSSKPKLTNCIFWGNDSDYYGGYIDEVYNADSADPNFRYCDVKGCGGSGSWNSNYGTDGGGNIDLDPYFANSGTPAGPDGVFATLDDGLRVTIDSPCIDAADGDAALSLDIIGLGRVDVDDVGNTGTGDPNYVDMGYYEYGHDSDGDGMCDDWELVYGFDPLDSNDANEDADSDDLNNLGEYNADTDPLDPDTDDDYMPDGWEHQYGLDPLDPDDADGDKDGDSHNNLSEYLHGSDPTDDGSVPSTNITIDVPEDAACIQDAIDASIDGDTILVAKGTYNETVDFNGVACTVRSTDPNDWDVVAATVIDADNSQANVVTFDDSEDTNSVLEGFTITGGARGIYCSGASPTITKCVIRQNGSGSGNGAGMYNSSGSAVISRCIFTKNNAGSGGGIYNSSSSPSVTNCAFFDNDADFGAGIYNSNSSPMLTNCVFSDNIADVNGGGIYNNGSSPTVVNCTLNSNEAEDGGGIYNSGSSSTPTLSNCILWGNNASSSGGEVYNTGSADPNFRYCDVNGCGGSGGGWDPNFGTDGGGNIDSDPCFADVDTPAGLDGLFGLLDDGLQLTSVSPCIDAADGDAAPSTDYAGRSRVDVDYVDNTGTGDPNYADMGAYELPTIWFVDVDASDGNGTSWDDAFTNLQDALTAAGSDDEIWVAEGTYKPTSGTSRSVSFQLVQGAGVYGGFEGTETCRSQRDWTAHETILSGEIGSAGFGDNSYHVVKGANNAILDGLTITAGDANGAYPDYYGGGMYNNSVSPTVKNCTFSKNKANYGGGAYNRNCLAEMSNCTYSQNEAAYLGGAMMNTWYCNTKITNCVFYDNATLYYGGAISNYSYSSPTITNCTFTENYAGYYGGAIYNYVNCSPTVTNCVLWADEAGAFGDEVCNMNSDPNLRYCDIEGCGGSGSGWDPNFGTDGGGNIDSDPRFVDADDAAGADGVFGTIDDGLRLTGDSPCIDAADGDAAPSTDLIGLERFDADDVDNTGTGDPDYVDMGAYELGPTEQVRVYTSSDYDDNHGIGLRDCQVHFGHKDGTGSYAIPDMYIEFDTAGSNGYIVEDKNLYVTSESDTTGIQILFRETGVNTNRFRTVNCLHLDTSSSQSYRQLKVLDEETIAVDNVNGPKVDRGEVATITVKFNSACLQEQSDDGADEFDWFFDKDEGDDPYYWWDGGEERQVDSRTTFSNFVKNVGNDSSGLSVPADFLFQCAHGDEGNILYEWWPYVFLYKPDSGSTPTIDEDDWEKDVEWVVLYSCNILGQGYSDPNKWTRYWDGALLRQEGGNNCHGILASSASLHAAFEHMPEFLDDYLKGDDYTIIDGYMKSALGVFWGGPNWGAAALFHLANVDDRLNNVTPDTNDPNMYYTWYAQGDNDACSETWTASYGASKLNGSIDETSDSAVSYKGTKITCDIPIDRPMLARVAVRKESPKGKPFNAKGFLKDKFDSKGRVSFEKQLSKRGPIRLAKRQARSEVGDFIKRRGGGMPDDAKLTAVRQQRVATYSALDPTNTRKEYVRKAFFEYTHSVNGIDIAGGNRGDSILVTVEGDQVVGLNRHWRTVIGPAGTEQRVISAGDALDVAVENIPKVILMPPDKSYTITEIKLFYHGLPSEQEDQTLTPVWGFRVGKFLWVYVDAFTGEFLY